MGGGGRGRGGRENGKVDRDPQRFKCNNNYGIIKKHNKNTIFGSPLCYPLRGVFSKVMDPPDNKSAAACNCECVLSRGLDIKPWSRPLGGG